MIQLRQTSKSFRVGQSTVNALTNITLTIPPKSFVAIAGASGSGKSTLLSLLGCIERADSGTVEIDGLDVSHLNQNQLARLRLQKLGFIFQTFNLLSILTARENVDYPLALLKRPIKERQERVRSLLNQVGLERFADHRPAQLSGGQRQRVAIARALASSPSIILADEPTANLDHATGLEIIALLKEFNRMLGITILVATHDEQIIRQADRVIELSDGAIVKDQPCT